MKNSILIALATMVLVLQAYKSNCQKILLKAGGELMVAPGYSTPIGAKVVDGESALLSNMKPGGSLEASLVVGLSSRVGIGGWTGYYNFTDWNGTVNPVYQGTSMKLLCFGGRIAYRLPVTSIRNKLDVVLSLSPGISNLNIETSADSEINGNPSTTPLVVESMRFTLGTHAGVQYNLTNSFGLTFRAGYQYTSADSEIFPDKNYSFVTLSIGAYLRLFKDKRYKYSVL